MDNTEPKTETRKVITVESLLQLKRHERPPAEFWEGFERRFEQKRLQALVQRPSALSRLAALFGALASPKIALAGASVAAVTLLLAGNGVFTVATHVAPTAPYYTTQATEVKAQSPVMSVAAADMRSGSSTSFALDTLSLGQTSRTAPTSTERLSAGYGGGGVFFATGTIANTPAGGATGFY